MMQKTISLVLLLLSLVVFFSAGWYNKPADVFKLALWVFAAGIGFYSLRYGIALVLVVLPSSLLINQLFRYPEFSFVEFALWGLIAAWAARFGLMRSGKVRTPLLEFGSVTFWGLNLFSLIWVFAHLPMSDFRQYVEALQIGARDLLFGFPQMSSLFPLRQFVTLSAGLGLFFILKDQLREQGKRKFIFAALHVSVGLSLLISVYYFVFEPTSTLFRFSGFLGETNQFAAFAMAVFSGYAVLIVCEERLGRSLQFTFYLVVSLFLVTLSFSKLLPFNLLVLVISVIVLFGALNLYSALPRRVWRHYLRVVLWAFLAAGFMIFIIAQIVPIGELGTIDYSRNIFDNFRNYLSLANMSSISDFLEHRRFIHWLSSAQMISDYPLSGVGVGRYYQIKALYSPELQKPYVSIAHENSFSTFLQIGAELGWLGLIVFLLLISAAIVTAVRGLRRLEMGRDKTVLLASVVALISLLFNFITTDNYFVPELHLWFWILLALIAALSPARLEFLKLPTVLISLGLLLSFGLLLFVRTPIQLPGLSDSVGLHAPEQEKDKTVFRWSDESAFWRQRLRSERMVLLLSARRPEHHKLPLDFAVRFGETTVLEKELLAGESVAVQALIAAGEGNDGLVSVSLRADPALSPFKLGASRDGRYLGAEVRGPFWRAEELKKIGAIGKHGLYSVEESSPKSRGKLWFASRTIIIVDGTLPLLKLRLKVAHPDIKKRHIILSVTVNGKHALRHSVREKGWLVLEVPLPPDANDSVVEIRVDRTFRPSDFDDSDDHRVLGFMIDLDSLNRQKGN